MVICKYFQSGNCRFGPKCMNEHVDVKLIIKTEVEAALKGSQWPLSCFGPFKEKPSIPNFIEDQSFEEIRFSCYEAKKQNCFPAFHQQFTQQVMEAQNKMKQLLTLNRDVIEVVTNLYNNADTTKKAPQTTSPFAMAGSANSNQSTNLFGSSTNQSNPFSNTGSSLFGGTATSNANSIFGGQLNNTNSVIGQSNFASSGFDTSSQGSLFGQQTSSFGQPGGNIFSMRAQPQQQQQQQQQQQSSIFGGNAQIQQTPFSNTTSFGTTPQTNLFGQPQQQQQPLSGGNLFTQQNQNTGFGAFGQNTTQMQQAPQQNQQTSGFGVFGQNPPQPQQASVFGMQQQQQQQPQQNQNVFGSTQQNLQHQQQQNAFGMQAQQPQNLSTSTFGNAQQNVQNTLTAPSFGNVTQPQQQSAQNLFGLVQQQQNSYQQMGTFGNPNQQQTNFGNMIPDIPYSENLYSKMETLSPEEIEAFKADKFEIGKIPTNPPPRELVQFK